MGQSVGKSVRRRFKWSILLSLGLVGAILLAGIWMTFAARKATSVDIEAGTGNVTVRGTEEQFVGSVTGMAGERMVRVNGLPVWHELRKEPIALRAVCLMRGNHDTDWSKASDALRGHLQSSQVDALCKTLD